MRFRAKISNENLNLFHNIISHLQRSGIGDKMAVYLTTDHLRLAAISDEIDSTKCYSELSVDSLFTEYLLESRADNCVLFEIGLDNLSKALQSGRHAVQVLHYYYFLADLCHIMASFLVVYLQVDQA
jgi:hypothetical protein